MTHEQAIETMAAERYWLGEMTEAEQQAFEAHYFDCAECADGVRADLRMTDGVRAAGAEARTASPAPPARIAGRWKSSLIPLAAAAVLTLVVGYQNAVVIPGLRAGLGSQALTPVVLRAENRGESPEVILPSPSGRGMIALTLDVNLSPSPADVVYELKPQNGPPVVTRTARVPPPGVPLLILVPGSALSPGPYTLSLRDPAAPQKDLATYAFVAR
jgi:hypothetical protein